MSDNSSDTLYFGTITRPDHGRYFHDQQRIFKSLRFNPSDEYFCLCQINTVGPTVCVGGWGKYGAGMPITNECWEELSKGVVISEWQFFEDWILTIKIANEEVFSQKVSLEELLTREEKNPEYEFDFDHFEGRTDDERAFFSHFWTARESVREQRRLHDSFEWHIYRLKHNKKSA